MERYYLGRYLVQQPISTFLKSAEGHLNYLRLNLKPAVFLRPCWVTNTSVGQVQAVPSDSGRLASTGMQPRETDLTPVPLPALHLSFSNSALQGECSLQLNSPSISPLLLLNTARGRHHESRSAAVIGWPVRCSQAPHPARLNPSPIQGPVQHSLTEDKSLPQPGERSDVPETDPK